MGTEGMAGRGALTTLTVFLVSSQDLRQAKVERNPKPGSSELGVGCGVCTAFSPLQLLSSLAAALILGSPRRSLLSGCCPTTSFTFGGQ